jgi:hypothetical protein
MTALTLPAADLDLLSATATVLGDPRLNADIAELVDAYAQQLAGGYRSGGRTELLARVGRPARPRSHRRHPAAHRAAAGHPVRHRLCAQRRRGSRHARTADRMNHMWALTAFHPPPCGRRALLHKPPLWRTASLDYGATQQRPGGVHHAEPRARRSRPLSPTQPFAPRPPTSGPREAQVRLESARSPQKAHLCSFMPNQRQHCFCRSRRDSVRSAQAREPVQIMSGITGLKGCPWKAWRLSGGSVRSPLHECRVPRRRPPECRHRRRATGGRGCPRA